MKKDLGSDALKDYEMVHCEWWIKDIIHHQGNVIPCLLTSFFGLMRIVYRAWIHHDVALSMTSASHVTYRSQSAMIRFSVAG